MINYIIIIQKIDSRVLRYGFIVKKKVVAVAEDQGSVPSTTVVANNHK